MTVIRLHIDETLITKNLAVSLLLLIRRKFDDLHLSCRATGLKAVSYTHLDVYKRQVLVRYQLLQV